MTPKQFLECHSKLSPTEKLSSLVSVLRGPQGCAWDQKQTALNMIDCVIDEAHELKAGLLSEDDRETVSELGDLLFTVEFLTQTLASTAPVSQAATSLVEKMVGRHPHVFADRTFESEAELKKNWEAEKRREASSRSRLDEDIPKSLPPLSKASKVLSRAMNSGFRYLRLEDAWDKVSEELHELEACLQDEGEGRFEEEFGDLLLSLLTVAKMKGCRADNALGRSVSKLCDRLAKVEELASSPLEDIPHAELGPLYQAAKGDGEGEVCYFNYCGVSPWPRPVRNGIRRASQRLGSEGLSAALDLRLRREAMRERIRDFCSAPAESSVVYVPNISSAALGVAYAQDWKPKDKVLLGKGEFPANTVPWRSAAQTFGLQPIWFDDDLLRTNPEAGWAELERLLQQEKPHLMALSVVSFWSGFRVDVERLAELCSRYPTRLFLDSVQALGNTPFRWQEGIDYLAAGSHKGLLAPEAAGFMIVDSQVAADWRPRLSSWLSLPEPVNFLIEGEWDSLPNGVDPRCQDPTTLEGGSVNTLGYAGLEASLEMLQELGPEKIFQRITKLQDPLEAAMIGLGWKSLRAAEADSRSGLLSFQPPEGLDLPKFAQRLGELGVSVGTPNGALRFGFHAATQARHVDRAIQILKSL